jgi:hypothetical protein
MGKDLPSVFSTKKDDIEQTVTKRLETFEREFEQAFNKVWVAKVLEERAKQKKELKGRAEVKYYRARKDKEKDPLQYTSNDIGIRVQDWDIVDSDVEPYIVYVIKATAGKASSVVYRRFHQVSWMGNNF